jgi:hypothetical protein
MSYARSPRQTYGVHPGAKLGFAASRWRRPPRRISRCSGRWRQRRRAKRGLIPKRRAVVSRGGHARISPTHSALSVVIAESRAPRCEAASTTPSACAARNGRRAARLRTRNQGGRVGAGGRGRHSAWRLQRWPRRTADARWRPAADDDGAGGICEPLVYATVLRLKCNKDRYAVCGHGHVRQSRTVLSLIFVQVPAQSRVPQRRQRGPRRLVSACIPPPPA